MLTPASTAHPVHIMLADPQADLGQIMLLDRALKTHIRSPRQIRSAPAVTLRAVRHPLIRNRHPRQGAARRALLRAPSPPSILTRPGCRLGLPRKVITGGRHRGVPAVAADHPFQPRDPLHQPGIRRGQLLDHPGLLRDHPIPCRARPALRRKDTAMNSPSHDHQDPARDQRDTPANHHITPNQTTSPTNPRSAAANNVNVHMKRPLSGL